MFLKTSGVRNRQSSNRVKVCWVWHVGLTHLYGGMCVVFVGCVEGELDLEDLGGTQKQFLPLLCAPVAKRVLAVAAAVCSSTSITTPRPTAALSGPQCFHSGFTWLTGPLTLALGLILAQIGGVTVLFSRVSLHIHRFVFPSWGRLWEGPRCSLTLVPFGPHSLSPRHASFMCVVLDAAETVSKAADLSDDQVNEGVDQLIEDFKVLVLLEAAETLSGDTMQSRAFKRHHHSYRSVTSWSDWGVLLLQELWIWKYLQQLIKLWCHLWHFLYFCNTFQSWNRKRKNKNKSNVRGKVNLPKRIFKQMSQQTLTT